jgi:hypothetical protein
MQVNDINTGSIKFDTLMKGFYDYYNSVEYQNLIKLIADEDISKEVLGKIPTDLLLFIYSLTNDGVYDELIVKAIKSSQKIIKQTRDIIEK